LSSSSLSEVNMKKIKITIAKDGTQKIEVLGAHGEDCIELTEELEKRLGFQVGDRTMKPEAKESAEQIRDENEVERS
jgi:hypothetical protein